MFQLYQLICVVSNVNQMEFYILIKFILTYNDNHIKIINL